ncbi:MAG: Cas8a1 family CRISPR/Cas system-associated protein [Caldimicrobium thiodismutans]
MSGNQIILYPSTWLYNAGVIGLLQSAEQIEKFDVKPWLKEDGSVSLYLPFFSKLNSDERYFGQNKISSIVGKSNLYRNFLQPNQKDIFKEFVKALDFLQPSYCDICGNGRCLDHATITNLNNLDPAKKNDTKFLYRIQSFTIVHYSNLGPSLNEFPNAFWNLNQSAKICHLCSFLIIHHHLAMTRLSDGSEIFINAPSFQVMWYLNKFAREIFSSASSEEMRTKRSLLAMSVIEYATKIKTALGVWTGMNIEVVSKRSDQIEFFSLPYEVIQLLSDRRIASILSEIGEFEILNRVLDQDFSHLMEVGYLFLRIGLKPYNNRAKSENDFINRTLRLEKNRRNPAGVAEQIFKLCALVEEKKRKRRNYEYIY